ncbi:MAG: ATP-binding cassette domain-containing protein, partial [Candidatus Dojkabacteria bacterium]|nr:ATP-binding cassette domain-containing protein [Candidatus Dojkabacteria bacterium]
GVHGGKVIFAGDLDNLKQDKFSVTAPYIRGEKIVGHKFISRSENISLDKVIRIKGARQNNLKNIDVSIPIGKFVCITGVSGSGKSTLINDILYTKLHNYFYGTHYPVGLHDDIEGLEHIDKVIAVDQSPIGRTPRSNPATYVGFFDDIRDLFANTNEAKMRGYKSGRFSFNVKGGRCESCKGDGIIKIEMQFLPDVYVTCDACGGKRYNRETLEITYRGKNIYEVLEMTVDEALVFFQNIPRVFNKLNVLQQVGLGYIKLGQQANTLSGGESQRIKLATELAKKNTGRTLYILDEPTTGLHFEDVNKLLDVLHSLRDKGNTILVIEHNLDVIKTADYIIDLGPEGGDKGGDIVACGTPLQIIQNPNSWTGKYLKDYLV